MLGFSGITGVTQPDATWAIATNAPDRLPQDVPHEYDDVQRQIAGAPPMSGFSQQPYGPSSLQAFGPGNLPVLTALASQYAVFDNWYSSMPGPTWPNRFFVHAASSGGLDNSPSSPTIIEAESIDWLSFEFEHGTIFERIASQGRRWRVYHAGAFPQALAIRHMVDPFLANTDEFRSIDPTDTNDTFRSDLGKNYNVDYTFIEPNHDVLHSNYQDCNSQHPVGSVAAGEAFIKYVYETIRNCPPVWKDSLLIVTYDEHGGFFDHQNPPGATAPGDAPINHSRAEYPRDCKFDRLGVRVPTVVVSPWIDRALIGSNCYPGLSFDHSSIVRTVRDLFGLGGSLTLRDGTAPSFANLLSSAQQARINPTDAPLSLPNPAPASPPTAAASMQAGPDSLTKGFSRIALSLDLRMAQMSHTPPIAGTHAHFKAPGAFATRLQTGNEMRNYIDLVARQVRTRRVQAVTPKATAP